jgi:hypothetical protein
MLITEKLCIVGYAKPQWRTEFNYKPTKKPVKALKTNTVISSTTLQQYDIFIMLKAGK